MALLRLRRDPDGFTPSARDISEATSQEGRRKPDLSHGTVSSLLNGESSNPRTTSVITLARALDAPAAFLLPGEEWDDLTALTVYASSPEARQTLRLMSGLTMQDIVEINSVLREKRRSLGLPEDVPPIPAPPPGVDQPREGRPRRRLSLTEAAERAAADLEGR
jgi:transcriptional regulator with XRE-family HTH domain